MAKHWTANDDGRGGKNINMIKFIVRALQRELLFWLLLFSLADFLFIISRFIFGHKTTTLPRRQTTLLMLWIKSNERVNERAMMNGAGAGFIEGKVFLSLSHSFSPCLPEKKMRNLHDMQDDSEIVYSAMSGVSRLWITSRSMKKYAAQVDLACEQQTQPNAICWILEFQLALRQPSHTERELFSRCSYI